MATALVGTPVRAGAGWGDSTNPAPDPAISQVDSTGAIKVRTYYANSPQGLQFDALTGLQTRDTGKALRKFVDPLPTLGPNGSSGTWSPGGASTAGAYIPVAVGDTASYPGSVYYEIAVVEYTQRMHSDLAKATTLRGYVQIDPVATDALAGITGNVGVSPAGSKQLPLFQLDNVTPVLISRPSTRATAVNGFEQVQAVAVDNPSYLGPTIVAVHGTPTRVKFYNGLPAGHGFTDAAGTWHRQGDLFIPVDHTLFGGGDGQHQTGFKDLLCGDVLAGPNNAGTPSLSACAATSNADGTTTPAGYVHVPKFELYTENREELHLHGGDNPWISDGHPHQWITPAADELNATETQNYKRGDIAYNVPDMPNPGPGAVTYFWPNGQSGRLLFYHDHATGLTRLNVYAGTAAGYALLDAVENTFFQGVLGTTDAVAAEGNPLVIQEKTFVPKDIATEDAKWDSVHWGQEGDLWFPHVYETNQDPLSADATNPVGRWDGASFFWPVFPQNYATPSGEYGNVTTTPESFMDTPIVNGMAYPTVTVGPQAYRFRILGVGNDRMLNLSFYVADNVAGTPVPNTEVKMVPFNSPNGPTSVSYTCPDGISAGQTVGTINANGTITKAGYTESGPSSSGITQYNVSFPCAGGLTDTGWGQADNRPGGVPDPATAGPDIIRLGNEGGLFQQPVVIPATPINYEYNKRSVTVLNVLERGLWLGPAERADVIVDFSQYAGKTLILYNDSGAPVPAGDPRIDYYTGDGDQTGAGGAPNTLPGYGPNSRTIMQFVVGGTVGANGTPFALGAPAVPAVPATATTAAIPAVPASGLYATLPAVYLATQPKPVVPTPEYKPLADALTAAALPSFSPTAAYEHIYTGSIYLNKYNALAFTADDTFKYTPAPTCATTATCLTALAAIRANPATPGGLAIATPGTAVSAYVESKAIQELFEADYGRMNATLGVELPFTNVTIQTTIPLAYVDPATETIAPGEVQFWKITHNGVDSHPVHFHFINVQVINRVGWDGTIKTIPADEVGWKETVKMHPLEDIIVAVRAKSAPPTPFGMPHSYRQPAPNQLASDNHGITQIDPATGNAPATPYTNAAVDYFSEYVWHCHILGHEENDFMRPFLFKAQEVKPAAPVLSSATSTGTGIQLAWLDATPVPAVLSTYDPITNPTGFLGNPGNEIGFRVERGNAANATTAPIAYTAVSTGLLSYNAITRAVNAPANSTTYLDPVLTGGVALPTPAAPAYVSRTATSVTLTLPALPAGAASLSVYRNGVLLAANQAAGTYVDTTALLGGNYSYTVVAVGPVTAGTSFYGYRVFAVTAAGDSLPSNVKIAAATPAGNSAASVATTVLMPPTAPTGVTVTNPTVGSLQVNWPAAPAAQAVTGYLVSTNGAAAVAAASPDVVTGLAANTTYSFTVSAVNATATGAASAAARGLTLPTAPSSLTVGTVTGTSVALSWTAPVPATGLQYVVQVVPAAGTVTYTGTTAVVNGLAPTTSYTFTVVASNVAAAAAAGVGGGGLSAPSNAVTAQTLAGAPTGLAVTAIAANSVSLSWTAPANSVGVTYRVNVTPATGTAAITGTTAVVGGLASNASYSFTVVAINSAAVASPPSNTVTALTLPGTSGTPIVGAITSSSVALTWAAPAGGAASYIVQYSTTAAFTPATSFSQPAPTTGVTVTGLAPSTSYYFRIVAANATGSGAASAAVQATTAAGVPQAPTGLVFSNVSATTITASWTAVTGATSYDATVTPGALLNVGAPTRALTGLAGNTTYAFSIRARNAAGASVAALTGSQLTLPAAPATPVVGAITSSSVALSWAAPLNGATGYSVQYSTNGFATYVTTSAAVGTSATVPGLASGTVFSFRVVAVNATGNSLPSGVVNASTSVIAGGIAPTPAVTAVTTTNVTLSWTAVTGATSYTLYRNGVAVWTGTTTTVNQAGQVAGNTYGFTLAVTTAAGLSAQSAAVSATTLALQPVAPTVSIAGNTAANHLVTVTLPAKPATETAAISYTISYQLRAARGGAWGAVTVIRTGITATGAAQAIALNVPAAGRYRFSVVAVDAGGSSAASPNSAQVRSL